MFTLKNGITHPYTRFMELPELSPGYVWRDVSPLGSGRRHYVETVEEKAAAHDEIFGYSMTELMAKQYK